MVIQTRFQSDAFRRLGSRFLGIDGTHNTTCYSGVQLITLMARDNWGHGKRMNYNSDKISADLLRCAGCLDAVIQYKI